MLDRRAAPELRAPDRGRLSSAVVAGLRNWLSVRICSTTILVGGAIAAGSGPLAWSCLAAASVLGAGPAARFLPAGLGMGLALGLPWPAPAAVAVIAWAVASATVGGRASAAAVRRAWAPTPPRRQVALAVGVGLIAGLATLALSWGHFRSDPLLLAHQRPGPLTMTVVVAALALANSLSEELLWRVALWRPATGVTLTLLAQALSFGVAHAGGLPGGPMGMAAAAVYSGVLAGLRWRYGFSVAVTCHLSTDVVIFGWVAIHAIYLPA
jgi:hypothetical protein